jgi:hypothetical protein
MEIIDIPPSVKEWYNLSFLVVRFFYSYYIYRISVFLQKILKSSKSEFLIHICLKFTINCYTIVIVCAMILENHRTKLKQALFKL